jgi:DNA invertase Pin-like site-specific DNA recombinase
VAIYARYSSHFLQLRLIEDQIALCRAFAERHGWVVVGVFSDAERSGTTVVGRSGFFSMMASADAGEFSLLLVEDLDRLSRNPADTRALVDNLEAIDVDICTVAGGMVSAVEVAFRAVQNQQYLEGFAQKIRRGQQGAVRSGRISGIAYGYSKVFSPHGNGLREINAAEAAVVVRIFTDYVSGSTTTDICRALDAAGVPPPKGNAWRPDSLSGRNGAGSGILRNKLYVGEFHWGRTRRRRDCKTGVLKVEIAPTAQRVVALVPHLRIIDDHLFEAAQVKLEARS